MCRVTGMVTKIRKEASMLEDRECNVHGSRFRFSIQMYSFRVGHKRCTWHAQRLKIAGSRFRVQGVALPLDIALERGQLSSLCVVNRQLQVIPLEAVDEYSVHESGSSIQDSKPTMAPGPKTLKYSGGCMRRDSTPKAKDWGILRSHLLTRVCIAPPFLPSPNRVTISRRTSDVAVAVSAMTGTRFPSETDSKSFASSMYLGRKS
jgi:hypothetical protein